MQEESLSPVNLLASFLSQNNAAGELLIITGERGAGKTTWCSALVDQARLAGLTVDGLLSPAVFDSGAKIGIDLVAIGTGARRSLAVRRDETGSQSVSGPHTAAWQFDSEALNWGNELLRRLPAVELSIVDEVGPLEILENRGLTAGLELLDRRQYRLACVVVRPELLGVAQARWPWGRVVDLSRSRLP